MNTRLVLAEDTIGQLAAKHPQLIPLFEKYDMDYACMGMDSVHNACARHGLPVGDFLVRIEELIDQDVAEQPPVWAEDEMVSLIEHIKRRYHDSARQTMHVLVKLSEHILAAGNSTLPSELFQKLRWVFQDLELHMQKEERILFPYLVAMLTESENPEACFDTPDSPMKVMEAEHNDASLVMREIKELSHNFQLTAKDDSHHRMFMRELERFYMDLKQHIHLENNVLFPHIRMQLA
ncbi:MAG: DUF542 domain-containing protein [Acidobacteria bacterium]|nr:DUF542 domain-containing protein [Acidobacteriota bacterium]